MGKPNGGPDDDAGSGFALHPHSDFRVNWDALSMIFLLYNVLRASLLTSRPTAPLEYGSLRW